MVKKSLIISLAILLFISGCGTGNTGQNNDGVGISFIENFPPESLREGGSFRVGLQLENGIEQQIVYDLCVSDLPANSYDGIKEKECVEGTIGPAQEVQGQIATEVSNPIYFPQSGTYSYNNLDLGVTETVIYAEATYDLNVNHVSQICILNKLQEGIPANCKFQQTLSGFVSDGGPIKVDSVNVDLSPEENGEVSVFLDLSISKNKGNVDRNIVFYSSPDEESIGLGVRVGNTYFSCTGAEEGILKITETNKKVNCKAKVVVGENTWGYTDTLVINTEYTNQVSISKKVPLKGDENI